MVGEQGEGAGDCLRRVTAISGYEGRYTISEIGEILNRQRVVVFAHLDRYGYYRVRLYGEDGRKSHRVHHLVCAAFHGPRSSGQEARHLDGDKKNNRADNLAWGTHAQNVADMAAHGKLHIPAGRAGEAHHAAKLSGGDVDAIRDLLKAGRSQRSVARQYGISQTQVCHIGKGAAWASHRALFHGLDQRLQSPIAGALQ